MTSPNDKDGKTISAVVEQVFIKSKGTVTVYHRRKTCDTLIATTLTTISIEQAHKRSYKACLRCSRFKSGKKGLIVSPPGGASLSDTKTTATTAEPALLAGPLQYARDTIVSTSYPIPCYYVFDTEGSAYLTQITLMPLGNVGKGVISYNLKIPDAYGIPAKQLKCTGPPTTLAKVWDDLDRDTIDAPVVYLLSHNGCGHDEPLLKRAAAEEKCTISKRYRFGDTVYLFRHLLRERSVTSMNMELLVTALLGEQPVVNDNSGYEWHRSDYDAWQLWRMVRFVWSYIAHQTRPNTVALSLVEARSYLRPEWPMDNRILLLMDAWMQYSRFPWRTWNQIQAKEPVTLHSAFATDARYCTRQTRHMETCRIAVQYKATIKTLVGTDPKLSGYKPCQICCFVSTVAATATPTVATPTVATTATATATSSIVTSSMSDSKTEPAQHNS